MRSITQDDIIRLLKEQNDFGNSYEFLKEARMTIESASMFHPQPYEPTDNKWKVSIRFDWAGKYGSATSNQSVRVDRVTSGKTEKKSYKGTIIVYNQYGEKVGTSFGMSCWVKKTEISTKNLFVKD